MYVFIVNPEAGGGRAMRVFSKIEKSELYNDIQHTHYFTEYRGHAEVIVHDLIETYHDVLTNVIVIGGDGTLHEVINGLIDYEIPVSFIPGGSGNDFARGCSIHEQPLELLRQIISGEGGFPYWLGNYTIDCNEPRMFANSIGFGFDAEIVKAADQSVYKKVFNKLGMGKISYVIAIIQVLFRFKPMNMEVEVNGDKKTIIDCWMLTVTNHPYYGGGMKIIPHATIQPSIFPIIVIHSISKWKILGLFMTVFTGKHVKYKEVELMEVTKLTVYAADEITYQVDGETNSCQRCIIVKEAQALQVMGTNIQKYKQVD